MALMFLVLVASTVLGLLIYWILLWWNNRQTIKMANEGVMTKVLIEIRAKKKPITKISLIEFLNHSPLFVTNLINHMLEKDLVRVDEDGITISEFGKHYYDKFLKRK